MTSFFDRMLGRKNDESKGSGATAKDRLKMVLTHDRIKISPEKIKEMKAEIIAVIAKYVPEVDPDSVDIALDQSDRYQNKLVAEIPFTKERGKPPVDNDDNDDLVTESQLENTSDDDPDDASNDSSDPISSEDATLPSQSDD